MAQIGQQLAELRTTKGLTQKQIAQSMAISEARVRRLEKQDNMRISSIRRYVEACGGKLLVSMESPDGTSVPFPQFSS